MANKQSFVSRAETKELRDYQHIASQFPPLTHEETCELSKKFCIGRDNQIHLIEQELFNEILKDDWSEENIKANEKALIKRLEDYLEECQGRENEPKDCLDKLKKDIAEIKKKTVHFIQSRNYTDKEKRKMRREIQKGDDALSKFCNHNLQLAMSRVGKCMRNNNNAKRIPIEELIAAANLGLVMGARQFDPWANNRFSTYAAYHIDGQIYALIDMEDGKCGIKSGTKHELKQQHELNTMKKFFRIRYGRYATPTELQSLSGVSIRLLDKRMNIPTIKTQSINAPISHTNANSNNADKATSLADILKDSDDVETEIQGKTTDYVMSTLRSSFNCLPPSYQKIIRMRMGLGDEGEETEPLTPLRISRSLDMSLKDVDKIIDESMKFLYSQLDRAGIQAEDISAIKEFE